MGTRRPAIFSCDVLMGQTEKNWKRQSLWCAIPVISGGSGARQPTSAGTKNRGKLPGRESGRGYVVQY